MVCKKMAKMFILGLSAKTTTEVGGGGGFETASDKFSACLSTFLFALCNQICRAKGMI